MGAIADAAPAWRVLLRSPVDFTLSALTALALVTLAGDGIGRLRRLTRHRRYPTGSAVQLSALLAAHAAAGLLVAAGVAAFVEAGVTLTDLDAMDWLRFSLHPWVPARVTAAAGLVLWNAAALWAAVLILRLAALWFQVPSHGGRRTAAIAATAAAAAAWGLARGALGGGPVPGIWPRRWTGHSCWPGIWGGCCAGAAIPREPRPCRVVPGAGPALALDVTSPPFEQFARARRQLIETRLAPEVTSQRIDVQLRVGRATTQIDALPDLADLVRAAAAAVAAGRARADRPRLFVWSGTDLARTASRRPSSSTAPMVPWRAASPSTCPSSRRPAALEGDRFALGPVRGGLAVRIADRRLLHAGRGLCVEVNGHREVVGAIVIHAMLDYGTLPFLTSQNPYVDLFRTQADRRRERASGRDVEFVVYGSEPPADLHVRIHGVDAG